MAEHELTWREVIGDSDLLTDGPVDVEKTRIAERMYELAWAICAANPESTQARYTAAKSVGDATDDIELEHVSAAIELHRLAEECPRPYDRYFPSNAMSMTIESALDAPQVLGLF